jgi:FdhD protein
VKSKQRTIERIEIGAGRTTARDHLVTEAPLVIQTRGVEAAVVMRTPGDDLELVRGLLHAEGIDDVALTQVDVDVVDVDVEPARMARRALTSTAACGVCGRAAIADLEVADWQIDASTIAALPARLREAQATFDETGGLHAAGLFDRAGALIAIREDVGRHNAVDKLVGAGLAEGARFGERVLVLSGRLGYELAQKAVLAGIPVIAAVSAPSTLAVEVCERFGITGCGFVRDGKLNVYSHGWRIRT